MPSRYMWFTALPPPPPTPITLMMLCSFSGSPKSSISGTFALFFSIIFTFYVNSSVLLSLFIFFFFAGDALLFLFLSASFFTCLLLLSFCEYYACRDFSYLTWSALFYVRCHYSWTCIAE